MKLLLITPPFTQLNTPYPATAYLKGFLNTKSIVSNQVDLGLEVILAMFSKTGLTTMFENIDRSDIELSDNSYRIFRLATTYINTIDEVILFLQNKNSTLAHAIVSRTYLPEASRFDEIDDLEWAFGTMGIQDKARHMSTLYLEDLADLIHEAVDPYFGFSRYAEKLSSAATKFNKIDKALKNHTSQLTDIIFDLLQSKLNIYKPSVVCLSIPFPGNLFAGLQCGKYIKKHYPEIKIVMGGGYPNTELRSLSEERLFDYIDFVCLDDGELPLLHLLEYLEGKYPITQLKRTFTLTNGVVSYLNGSTELDIPQRETGTPDYSDLLIHDYLSVIEIINPMHRLWSDGRWNKLTLAHGCYWGKCSFCDVTLDYIKRYEPLTASLLCDRIEEIITQTKQNGFHFVDEAAPPALLQELALEIIRRKITVVWWTNIRFEKNFTPDLCRLLKASGCIAISGGLEVASDRLLSLMKKGVSVSQVASVASGFTNAGILVHAYLMYGFPTQTLQETIDSLEMVRQLFLNGIVHSGFWHRFAMTAHSPVGIDPYAYGVEKTGPDFGGFADNDLYFEDKTDINHDLFANGLKKSLFNFMHGICLDSPLTDWFDFKVPKTSIPPDYIESSILDNDILNVRKNAIVVWLGNQPEVYRIENTNIVELVFYDKGKTWILETSIRKGIWLKELFPLLLPTHKEPLSYIDLEKNYSRLFRDSFEDFTSDSEWKVLKENGLLVL